jgi:hypothetical protein
MNSDALEAILSRESPVPLHEEDEEYDDHYVPDQYVPVVQQQRVPSPPRAPVQAVQASPVVQNSPPLQHRRSSIAMAQAPMVIRPRTSTVALVKRNSSQTVL